jgi:hypothetical protein
MRIKELRQNAGPCACDDCARAPLCARELLACSAYGMYLLARP